MRVQRLQPIFAILALRYAAFCLLVPLAWALQEGLVLAQEQTPVPSTKVDGYEYTFPALGTLVTFKTYHSDSEKVEAAFEMAEEEVKRLAAVLTDYDPNSETRKLGAISTQGPVKVSDDLWNALEASDRWYRLTEGAFDASLGNLTKLWRKHRRARRVPDSASIQTALEHSGWSLVELESKSKSARLRENVALDFGAIGKGIIIDAAFKILVDNGLDCSLVNISGNMRIGRAPPDRPGWKIEIAGITQKAAPLRRITVANTAIATSGDLWQFTEIDGTRHSHILDPRTGFGVVGPISATVIASSACDADAFATCACILPRSKTVELAKSLEIEFLVAHFQQSELLVETSEGFPAPFETESKRPK